MGNPTDDTELTRDAQGDTLEASDANELRGGSRPRIRPAGLSLGASPDYPELTAVDPAHYVFTREIARGGMGRIHVARDRRLGREVAVKEMLVKSAAIARRFEREARITARLQHPSIVSIHEAGTWPSGDPFYAMRLVSGRSLDEVITATPGADARVGLVPSVLAIADAMAYAHGERVIHRDLKPRNVVIGSFGETVVIDWGLAKDLRSPDVSTTGDGMPSTAPSSGPADHGATTAGDVLGTPAYIPPEQAAGTSVDERADVYAIGAILYHVLSGRPPFVADSQAEVLAAVSAGAPEPIAVLAPNVPGELVAIVERAMARDPAARYPTARELADDLRRFQNGQLVGAHRYSARQLLRRWIRRHRTAIAAVVAAMLVALGLGTFALVRIVAAQRVGEEQRALAMTNQTNAEELMQFILGDLRRKLEQLGRLDLLDTVARRASAYYATRKDTGTDTDLYLSGVAQLGIASVIETRGDLLAAKAEYEKARATLDRAADRRPDLPRYQAEAVLVRTYIARLQDGLGDLEAALATSREALERADRALAAYPGDVGVNHAAILCHRGIAVVLEQRGDLDGALAEYRVAMALGEANAKTSSSSVLIQKDLLNSHSSIGDLLLTAKHDPEGALAEYRIALAIGEREAAKVPDDVAWASDVATSHSEIGKVLESQNDLVGALAEYRAGAAIADRLAAMDPGNADWLQRRSVLHERIGNVLFARGDVAGALAEYQTCDAILAELNAKDPNNTDWLRDRSVLDNKLGDVQLAKRDPVGAAASYRAALTIREGLVARDPSHAGWRRDLFYSHIKFAQLYDTVPGKPAMALAELRAALAIAEETAARNPTNSGSQWDVVATHKEIGNQLVKQRDIAGARVEYEVALDIARRQLDRVPTDPEWKQMVEYLEGRVAAMR